MPIIASAKKKMRQDRKRTQHNLVIKQNLKSLIKIARREATAENLQKLQSALDKAVKVNLIHKNTASRLKSRLSKGTSGVEAAKKSRKKAPVRKVSKKK